MSVGAPSPSSKSKAAIAAMHRGPGAGRYLLPSTCGFDKHDCTRRKGPAFSFGKRLEDLSIKSKQCSPGPIYSIEPNWTRYGKDGTPKYTVTGRARNSKSNQNPGPAAYNLEKLAPPNQRSAPNFSMASRLRFAKDNTNPAPNRYGLPSMLGSKIPNKLSSSSYTISPRIDYEFDKTNNPSAAHYSVVNPNFYKSRAPAHFLGKRVFVPEDHTQKPGPGAHYPEHVTITRPKAPVYSQGIRHSEFTAPLLTNEDLINEEFFKEDSRNNVLAGDS